MNPPLAGRPTANGFASPQNKQTSEEFYARFLLRAGLRSPSPLAECQVPLSLIGLRTAIGSPSRRSSAEVFRYTLCRLEAVPEFRWLRGKTLRGPPIRAPWHLHAATAGQVITSCLCLTCPPNNTRMFPGSREVIRNHNPVGQDSPATIKTK